jgi:hypothetical protein
MTSSICASPPGLFWMVPPDSTLYGTFRQLCLAARAIHSNQKSPLNHRPRARQAGLESNGHLMKDQG